MTSALTTAYLLVTHGSRDPRSQAGAEHLVDQVRRGLVLRGRGEKRAAIAHATLELASAPLHRQIEQFAQKVIPLGVTQIQLLPLFLLPGVHVREDLPEQIAIARKTLKISLGILPHLGAEQTLLPVLKAQQAWVRAQLYSSQQPSARFQQTDPVDWLLLAHGSRRPGATQAIAALAQALGATPAYWVGSPSLADAIVAFHSASSAGKTSGTIGDRPLGLLSYFFFEGGITDRLQQQFEKFDLPTQAAVISPPLNAFPELAGAVIHSLDQVSLTQL